MTSLDKLLLGLCIVWAVVVLGGSYLEKTTAYDKGYADALKFTNEKLDSIAATKGLYDTTRTTR